MAKPEMGQPPPGAAWRWVSERGLRLVTGEATLARYAALARLNLPEIEDIIPADGSVLLILHRGEAVSAALRQALVDASLDEPPMASATLHEIAVEYGGVVGPDLAELAQQAGMDRATYINSHSAVEYAVAFLGFQPGFPYLNGLPSGLRAPRRASPRVRVPAGSVAVGGGYCGIYPASGPGGWHLIGRTDAVLFDPQRAAPALLLPGDRVRFVPK
jgi:KipI family sensor histidine kinase inhibitor